MLHLVYGQDAEVAAWVAARLPFPVEFGPHAAIGVAIDGKPAAGVVLHGYDGRADISITTAAAVPGWCSRRVCRAVFGYTFTQLGCARVTAITQKNNKAARRFLEKLGFRHEGTHPNSFDGHTTAISYGMTRADCRWI